MFLFFVCVAPAKVVKFSGDKGSIPITYYSMVKPQHVETKMCLSSIEFSYHGGSRQQMTRAVKAVMLSETLWTIYPGRNITNVHQGEPVKCGDVVRFQHATTRTWLHSHNFESQLGGGLEVSAFPEGEDDGNDWVIECSTEDEEAVTMDSHVTIKHALVGCYLATNEAGEYPAEIAGNWEVFCDDSTEDNDWVFDRGIVVAEEADEEDDDGYGEEYYD